MAKNEELGLELVTLLNTKEKLQHDKEAVELEKMQVNYIKWCTFMIYNKAPNSDECLCVNPRLNVYSHVLALFLMQLNEI